MSVDPNCWSIGHLMATAVPTCNSTDTAEQVINNLAGKQWDSAAIIYVLDGAKLIGQCRITSLFQSMDDQPVSRLMESVHIRLHSDDGPQQAIYAAIKNDQAELPVIDEDGNFVGAITGQTIIDTLHREHFEEALLTAGIRSRGHRFVDLASVELRIAFLSRAPWLLFGLCAALAISLILRQFETTMQETIALAFFPPVIAYFADSIGTQSETIAVRTYALIEVDQFDYLQRECIIGLAIGSMLGTIGGLGALVIAESFDIGLIVGLSLFLSSTVATVIAAAIPMGFQFFDADPAFGSGPIATALQDIISILIYFMIAAALLSH